MMTQEIAGEIYLNAAEACRFLGISRDTFYRSVRGRVPVYQLGVLKRPHYKQSDLERLNAIHEIEESEEEK